MTDTTFFTAANAAYEPFVLPYIAGVLAHNANAFVEVCVEDPAGFGQRNRPALERLRGDFGTAFELREADFSVPPNHVRFMEEPRHRAPYTYIGDIDILVLDDVAPIHLRQMQATGLPYDNIVRPSGQRLSGLHFTRTEAHYPLGELAKNPDRLGDEFLLYRQVAARHPLPDPANKFRPLHGWHLTPNRQPRPRNIGWGFRLDLPQQAYFDSYMKLRASERWQGLLPFFDRRYRMLLAMLDIALGYMQPDADLELLPPYSLKELFLGSWEK